MDFTKILNDIKNSEIVENITSPETIEIVKKEALKIQKATTNIIQDISIDPKHTANVISEKLVGNIKNLHEANLEETHKSENLIKHEIPKIGDHIYVLRPAEGAIPSYTHHGIYIGNGEVIHYLSTSVQVQSIKTFSAGYKIRIKKDSPTNYPPVQIVERAFTRLGEDEYNVVINNCEHFCRWCRNGE